MAATASLELPVELKDKIERVARERNEDPASLLASAVESLLSTEEAQVAEVRRRGLTDSAEHYDNENAFARLDSFRPSHRNPPPK